MKKQTQHVDLKKNYDKLLKKKFSSDSPVAKGLIVAPAFAGHSSSPIFLEPNK